MKTMINVALPKGRLGEKVYDMFEKSGFECPSIKENNRKLIFENPEKNVRYFWVKPSDVAIYVERGAADIGVAGKDILLEYEPDIYELLDLDLGKCRMAVAAKADFHDDPRRTLRVATKFVNIAQNHYASKGRDIDIIHLNGSIEIAPILGLSDVIVDIVETGTEIDAVISTEMLGNIFYEGAPLHDGAVIIRGERVKAAGCVLPLTQNKSLSKDLGTRHRAGIGITENSDAITIIVSEETGIISVTQNSELKRNISADELKECLQSLQNKTTDRKRFNWWKGREKVEV